MVRLNLISFFQLKPKIVDFEPPPPSLLLINQSARLYLLRFGKDC